MIGNTHTVTSAIASLGRTGQACRRLVIYSAKLSSLAVQKEVASMMAVAGRIS
jgi:hypothetical protein